VLALDALRVLRRLSAHLGDRPRDAGPWGGSAFAREVDRVRCQLAPIRDRRGLASSYRREAFRQLADRFVLEAGADSGAPTRQPDPHPTSVAYAVRWLELGDGVPRPAWTSLVTGSA